MESVRKHRDIKLVTTKKKKKLFDIQTKLSYNKVFLKKSNSNRNGEKIFVNKPVYLGLSVLEISKLAIYEFWYDSAKLKYNEKAKLSYNYVIYTHCPCKN